MEELPLPLVSRKKKKTKAIKKEVSTKMPKPHAKAEEKQEDTEKPRIKKGVKAKAKMKAVTKLEVVDAEAAQLVTAKARDVIDLEPTALEPDVIVPTQTDQGTFEPEVSALVEALPNLDLSQDQIDRIHRGRKTTVLTKARKELDWEVGDRVRLPDGTILKILRKEKITLGLNVPEDLVESEGFSPENRAEFARHLQRLGVRANDTAFLYRIELSD